MIAFKQRTIKSMFNIHHVMRLHDHSWNNHGIRQQSPFHSYIHHTISDSAVAFPRHDGMPHAVRTVHALTGNCAGELHSDSSHLDLRQSTAWPSQSLSLRFLHRRVLVELLRRIVRLASDQIENTASGKTTLSVSLSR